MQSGSSGSESNWNLEMLVSEEGGVENPVQCVVLRARARTNNKLNPDMKSCLGFEPCGMWVLSSLQHSHRQRERVQKEKLGLPPRSNARTTT